MSEQFDLFLDSLVFSSPLPFIVFSTLSGSNWAMKGICVLTSLYLYYFLGVLSSPFVALDSIYNLLTPKCISPAQTFPLNSRLIYLTAY